MCNEKINFLVIDAGLRYDDLIGWLVCGEGVGFAEQGGVTGGQVRGFRRELEDARVTAVLHKRLDCNYKG